MFELNSEPMRAVSVSFAHTGRDLFYLGVESQRSFLSTQATLSSRIPASAHHHFNGKKGSPFVASGAPAVCCPILSLVDRGAARVFLFEARRFLKLDEKLL